MSFQPSHVDAKPPSQLPRGRYPASPTTIWLVAITALLMSGAALAAGIAGR